MLTFNIHKSINLLSKRYIRKRINFKSWPNDWVPFHWSRPETIPGYMSITDLERVRVPEIGELRPQYLSSEKLKKLDPNDPVRKIFSMDHASLKSQTDLTIQQAYKEFGLYHEIDFDNSLEAKIIRLTFKLRGTLADLEYKGYDNPRTGRIRSAANAYKNRRKRYLNELKEQHAERYKHIIDKLNIEPEENPINVPRQFPFRKFQMRRMANEYAMELKGKKVEEFMKSLEQDKANFEVEKQETLKWIEEQEKKLNAIV